MSKKEYRLSELNAFIKRVLALNLKESLWVRGEWSEIKESRGHWYGTLIEKQEDEIIAQSQTVLWKGNYLKLKKSKKGILDDLLREGINVLVKVKVDYHERFGLKLLIEDIDATYTLGKLALKRKETFERLKQEGLLTLNKELVFPRIVQRVAVISSSTAAGLADFSAQLAQNPNGYRFHEELFEASMQGNRVIDSVGAAIESILSRKEAFDAIVLIRGGGSKIDLSDFDEYEVCKKIAESKLPVLTGIGHEIDESLSDLVAFHSFKTPTAVANFLIDQMAEFEMRLEYSSSEITQITEEILKIEARKLERLISGLQQIGRSVIQTKSARLNLDLQQLKALSSRMLLKEKSKLDLVEAKSSMLDLEKTLSRGFSLTLKNDKILKDVASLKAGDQVDTVLHKGRFLSEIKEIDND